jgi:hypothetical protein
MTNPTPLYESLVWELRKQILDLGITMSQADDVAGLQNGYLGKALHASTPSGRQAGWRLLQYLVDAIFAGGFTLTIKPVLPIDEIREAINRKLAVQGDVLTGQSSVESARLRGMAGKIAIRDYARFAGRKGNQVRNERLSPAKRSAIAKKAARARWSISTDWKHQQEFATKPNGRPLNGPHQK